RRIVLLGEASHGTSEFYTWRARITRRLIEERGFDFVAVEGDWPDCHELNRFVRGMPFAGATAHEVLQAFARWPTWMWANREVVDFSECLRRHDFARPRRRRVGFYGLDVYSLQQSMAAVLDHLDRVDPDAVERARDAYGCFDRYRGGPEQYALAMRLVPESCEQEVVSVLAELLARSPDDERTAA